MSGGALPESVEDLLGNAVRPGDRIVYAALNGRSAALRAGHVLGFQWSKEADYFRGTHALKVKIQADTSSGIRRAPSRPVFIEAERKHFLRA